MRRAILLISVLLIVGLTAGALALRVVTIERHTGYIGPIWTEDGAAVLALKREAEGIALGPGWEFFSPPARVYMRSDRYSLIQVAEDGTEEVLAAWAGSPLEGRWIRTYRGRVLTVTDGRLMADAEGLRVQLRISIPTVPRSEIWGVDTVWGGTSFSPEWRQGLPGQFSRGEDVLARGREVMTVPGPEGFDAGIVAIDDRGTVTLLARAPGFERQYPGGLPPEMLVARSARDRIERGRLFRERRAALIGRIMEEEGLDEGPAMLRAYDVMEAEGLLPPRRRIVAEAATDPADRPVFDIPRAYLDVGLFQDIAEAIAEPGRAVLASTGSYLVYAGDDLGPRLRAHLEEGDGSATVRVDGVLYRIAPR